MKNLNKTYQIKLKYVSRGVEYYQIDFPKLATKSNWIKIWKDLFSKIDIIKTGSTAITIKKKDLGLFDDIIEKYKELFTIKNKYIKGSTMSKQLGLLDKQKGYYPERN